MFDITSEKPGYPDMFICAEIRDGDVYQCMRLFYCKFMPIVHPFTPPAGTLAGEQEDQVTALYF
jgi:hypothetical protein